ncbi:hypothetical protein BO78DRAFT_326101, partial [Aspergillus sclerotiicarbonarius CBS 121057]
AMSIAIHIQSQTRVQPTCPPNDSQTVLLSILDAAHLTTGTAATILLYDAVQPGSACPLTSAALQGSLARALNGYAQWCGALHRQPGNPGRLMLTFGGPAAPGVALVVATADCPLAQLLPADRAPVWDVSAFPEAALLPATPLSLTDLTNASLPNLAIQVTTFSDGGLAVALRIAHPLADAHCLAGFALHWAATLKTPADALVSHAMPPQPIFDPQQLDRFATGDQRTATTLPLHHYDPWISSEGCPLPGRWTQIPPEFESLPLDPPGELIPWQQWDPTAAVAQTVLHFTPTELQALWTEIQAMGDEGLSYHDALLAHLWSCVTRARRPSHPSPPEGDPDAVVYLTYALGLRNRMNPPLPSQFLGSPTVSAAIAWPAGRVWEASLPDLARHIRATVAQFTPDRIAAYLHVKLHQQCPHRYWPAFMGRGHLMATSWVGTRLYDVDLGMGRPRFVKAVLPRLDGMLHLMEGAPCSPVDSNQSTHWTRHGVDVMLHLEAAAMDRLLRDPLLWRFRDNMATTKDG